MCSQLTTLQELALDMVLEDHQSVAGIEEQVKLLLGNGVSRQQISSALETLRELRLVDAYIKREKDQAFERYRRPKLKAGAALWWYATDEGRCEGAGNS